MDKIKRNERIGAMARILTAAPNHIFTLGRFCGMFEAAKSTVSEDVELLRKVFAQFDLGQIETVTGAAGGVRFVPRLSQASALAYVQELCGVLSDPGRVLPGNFLYIQDLLSQPDTLEVLGAIMAGPYFAAAPDFVLTVETKGIPFALMVARALGVQLVIARRDHKAFEGSVVTINYISGSGGEMKTMSLAKRAVRPGQKALIVDDFTKDGGTVRGMVELMQEFDVTTVGVGVMVERRREGAPRIYEDIRSLFIVSDAMDARQGAVVHPAPWLEVQE
ncbi:MAG TPA: pur operon repressor [Candidatus Spyradocola merdavium]|nr:pur operon repressor [Candidatus Spyradocola merdavium]